MYKKNIRIRTCGDDDALLEHLRQVPLPAYCNVTFCKEKDLGICDFCFVKFQEKENVAKACKNIFNESVIFLLEEGDHVAKDCWEHCFDCWHLDGDFEEICHRYAALLQRLELKHERDLEHKYLETIIDNSDALIWIKDNKGKHLEVNRTVISIFSEYSFPDCSKAIFKNLLPVRRGRLSRENMLPSRVPGHL